MGHAVRLYRRNGLAELGTWRVNLAPGASRNPGTRDDRMSSAEDMSSLATPRSASSSEAQPEEYPMKPGEGKASPSSRKPSTKTNMVAHEVQVKVTGTRHSKSAGERELFTEETNSVLVYENGGVIQLSAAVAPGQLLFLANVESKREVVAQVKRSEEHTSELQSPDHLVCRL